jgi:hypothetical protein
MLYKTQFESLSLSAILRSPSFGWHAIRSEARPDMGCIHLFEVLDPP